MLTTNLWVQVGFVNGAMVTLYVHVTKTEAHPWHVMINFDPPPIAAHYTSVSSNTPGLTRVYSALSRVSLGCNHLQVSGITLVHYFDSSHMVLLQTGSVYVNDNTAYNPCNPLTHPQHPLSPLEHVGVKGVRGHCSYIHKSNDLYLLTG